MRNILICSFAVFWLSAGIDGAALAQEAVVEVIPLHFRSAEQVIPVIEPMLGPDGSVSGLQGRLIIRTTPANLTEIRRVPAKIDATPRRLLITVRQHARIDQTQRGAEISGFAGNDRVRVFVPGSDGNVVIRPGGDERLRVRGLDAAASESEGSLQRIQVLEGSSALIQAGDSRPVPVREVRRTMVDGQLVEQVVDSVEHRDVSTGFYVRPRLVGDRVMLDSNPHRERFRGRSPEAVNVQRMATSTSGRLGEWIELGGVDLESNTRGSALFGATSHGPAESLRVLIKVDEVR